MHIVLALETSGRVGSIALAIDGQIIAEHHYPHGLLHAAALVPLIDQLLRSHSIAPAQLSEIHVSLGPGSFTGLRVGVTLAKTFAFATGSRIVAVPSLRVIAENAPSEASEVLVVLDAKRGQIFTARFARGDDGHWIERETPRLDTLAAAIARAPRPVHLIGEGIAYHRDAIPTESGVVVCHESLWQPRASSVLTIGRALAQAGHFADAFTLTPIYIRLPEAEEKRLIAEGHLTTEAIYGTPT